MTPDEKLHLYVDAVVNAPNSLSLTATRNADDFWKRHVVDALTLLTFLPPESEHLPLKVLDVGTGNGIPGLPIAIMRPKWQVELLDSINKKLLFLDTIRNKLTIENVRTIWTRAETIAHSEKRASYDIVFSRALSKLPYAIELCGAFLKINGQLIVPHGTSWTTEIEASKNTMKAMGVVLQKTVPYSLGNEIPFTALIFRKDYETPANFPRSSAALSKRSL